MNLTDEVIEMWEAEARRGSTDCVAANARILKLIETHREDTEHLADEMVLVMTYPIGTAQAFQQAVEEASP